MSRRDASAEDTAVIEAVMATGEETTIKEEDTENTINAQNNLFDVIDTFDMLFSARMDLDYDFATG